MKEHLSDMSLIDSLEALVEEHDRIGSPLRNRLAPGVPRDRMESALMALGLTPAEELIELFAWHEVRDDPGDKWRVTWFWPASPLRLDEAVDEYRHAMGIGGVTPAELELHLAAAGPGSTLTGFWRSDWFPILEGGEGAVQCGINGQAVDGSPVWRQNWHPNETFQAAQLAPTLTDFVDRIVELFRAGAYQWDAEYQAITTVDAVFDRLGLAATGRPWA
jgi:hypothetical protein